MLAATGKRLWKRCVAIPHWLVPACILPGLTISLSMHFKGVPVRDIMRMHLFPNIKEAVAYSCWQIAATSGPTAYVPLRDTGSAVQSRSQSLWAIEAALAALRRYPAEKDVQLACMRAVGAITLWSVPNGLRAAALGGIELFLETFRRWAHEPDLLVFGALGGYFDFVSSNRKRFGELGGVELLSKILRQHFGNEKVVLEVWYAFSSGTYDNAERFRDAGLIELGVQCMDIYAGAHRVREEVLQAFKAAAVHSEAVRTHLVGAGAPLQYVRTLRENATDPQVTSLVCENVALLVGGDVLIHSVRGRELGFGGFNATHQRALSELGAVEALLEVLRLEGSMTLRAMAAGYNVLQDCTQALAALADGHLANQRLLLRLGAPELLAALAAKPAVDGDRRTTVNGCKLLGYMAAVDPGAVKAAKPPPECRISL